MIQLWFDSRTSSVAFYDSLIDQKNCFMCWGREEIEKSCLAARITAFACSQKFPAKNEKLKRISAKGNNVFLNQHFISRFMGRINKDKYTVALQNIGFSELLCLLSLLRHLRLGLFLFTEHVQVVVAIRIF